MDSFGHPNFCNVVVRLCPSLRRTIDLCDMYFTVVTLITTLTSDNSIMPLSLFYKPAWIGLTGLTCPKITCLFNKYSLLVAMERRVGGAAMGFTVEDEYFIKLPGPWIKK